MAERAPTLSVVLPVYNEAANLSAFLAGLAAALDSVGESFEVVAVDDGSTDATWDCLVRESAGRPYLRALRLSRNFGKEAALAAGLLEARGHAVIVMDSDGQHPPLLIPELVQRWRSGAQIVEAVRLPRGDLGRVRRLGNRVFYGAFRALTGWDLGATCDFKLLDSTVVAAWHGMGEYGLFFRGMVAWLGFRRGQVSFTVPPRHVGASGWSIPKLLGLALQGITAFSPLPLRLVTLLGIGMIGLSGVVGAKALFDKLTGQAVTGFATVILLLLVIAAGIFISLGIIGEYLARIYDEVKRRPRYIVANRVGREGGGQTPP